jgi:hypothetical protein
MQLNGQLPATAVLPLAVNHCTHWRGNSEGRRAGLGLSEPRKILFLRPNSNPRSFNQYPIHYTDYATPAASVRSILLLSFHLRPGFFQLVLFSTGFLHTLIIPCACLHPVQDSHTDVLLTVHHTSYISIWNQHDALFIQFIENQEPLHASGITCSSLGGGAQTALGILRLIVAQPTDITRTQYIKCRLCFYSWGWASNDHVEALDSQ